MRRFGLSLLLVIPLSMFGVTANADNAPLTTKSPSQILAVTVAAMRRSGSFHYLLVGTATGYAPITLSTDSALTYGKQTETFSGGTESVRLMGKALFLYANAPAWKTSFGVNHPTLANEWVSVPPTNKHYVALAIDIVVPSIVQQIARVSNLRDLGVVTMRGQSVVALRGVVTASPAEFAGTLTLYVSTVAPYLPILETETGTFQGGKLVDRTVFSQWGEKFAVVRPANFVVATAKSFP